MKAEPERGSFNDISQQETNGFQNQVFDWFDSYMTGQQ